MTTFIVLFRKSNGSTSTVSIIANSVGEAMSKFMARYDGRIISVDAA
jgi:hypothetical protein